MEIVVRKADLVKELQLVQGIVERRSSIPILSNVLAEARGSEIRISATDLDVSLRCGCAAQVVTPGSITLAAKKLYEIARALPEADVRLKVTGDTWTEIECQQVRFRVAGLPREDFPSLPEAAPKVGTAIPADALRELIARTSFAITTEDARYYLAGALMVLEPEGVSMVATDGHRLAYAKRVTPIAVKDAVRVLIPRKAVTELARLLEGEDEAVFQQLENHLVFTVGGRTLSSKMIEGQFPAYEKVVAAFGDKKVTIARDRLATAIRRVSLLSAERTRAIKLALDKGKVELLASAPELGEARESLDVEYDGGPVDIGFNAQYLLDFLQVATSAGVQLELRDSESQGLLQPEGEESREYRYVVMPMRL